MITDAGGIFLEYMLAFKKPVIFIDGYEKIHNPYHSSIGSQSFEEMVKSKIALSIAAEDLKNIESHIQACLSEKYLNDLEEKIEELNNLMPNRGRVAETMYKQLVG